MFFILKIYKADYLIDMKYISFLVILILSFFPITLFSDMGAIIPIESVNLDEPAQRAIIAYDGFEEMLILQTELKPSEPTEVLRFIPLPSLPEIKIASKKVFPELKKLVLKYNLQYVRQTKSLIPSTEKVKIEIKKTIGAHNITIIKLTDTQGFIEWIKKYMKNLGYNYSFKNNRTYIDVLKHYINNKINYFVFDLVELKKQSSIDPIIYCFKSSKLYYPLVATNVLRSYGVIELFIFSETGRNYLSSLHGFMPSTTAIVNSGEMSKISPEFVNLLGKHAILQAFKYSGKLYFDRDINESSGIILIKPFINTLLPRKKHD